MSITKIYTYSLKALKSGAARIFIQNAEALVSSGMPPGTNVDYEYKIDSIIIRPMLSGQNKIMDTGRGPLLEVRNKKVAQIFEGLTAVSVTFKDGVVTISARFCDLIRLKRESVLRSAVKSKSPVRFGSFFSGTGLLSYHIRQGLSAGKLMTQQAFANDHCKVAIECNLSNPIWKEPTEDAVVLCDSLEQLDINSLPTSSIVEIAIPCINQSLLCKKEHRDLDHPIVGALFIKLCAALTRVNPAIIIIECSPKLLTSKTLFFIKNEMRGYKFESCILNNYDFGGLEPRPRACVVAISEGLPSLRMNELVPPEHVNRDLLRDHLVDVELDSPLWKKYEHIKAKEDDPKLNFKNTLYSGEEDKISCLTASYSAPKISTPFIQHKFNPDLRRQVTPAEHASIRGGIPCELLKCIQDIVTGKFSIGTKRGSTKKAHELLGNAPSPKPWFALGEHIANRIMGTWKLEC